MVRLNRRADREDRHGVGSRSSVPCPRRGPQGHAVGGGRPRPRRGARHGAGLEGELLGDDPLLERVVRIEQQPDRLRLVLPDRHRYDLRELLEVGSGRDRALFRIEVRSTISAVWGSSAPRQRRGRKGLTGVSARRLEPIGDDRAVGREVVGGAARRRSPRSLRRRRNATGAPRRRRDPRLADWPEWRVTVTSLNARWRSTSPPRWSRTSPTGRSGSRWRRRSGRARPPGRILVHEEPDRAAVHAEGRPLQLELRVQRPQQQAVAAEGHDHLGLVGRDEVAPAGQLVVCRLGPGRARVDAGYAQEDLMVGRRSQ